MKRKKQSINTDHSNLKVIQGENANDLIYLEQVTEENIDDTRKEIEDSSENNKEIIELFKGNGQETDS